jgi:O-antigen/teichoic acid export membrane protein
MARLKLGQLQRDSLLLVAAQAYYRLSGILLLVAISRTLPRHDIGLYAFAISFAESFVVIASLNLNPVMKRRVAADPTHTSDHLGALLGFRLASSPVYLAIVCIAALLTGASSLGVILVVALFTLLENIYFSFGSLFIADRRVGYNVGIGMVVQTLFLAGAVIGLYALPSLSMLLGAGLARSALLLALGAWMAHRYICPLKVRWDWGFIRESAPFVLATFVTLLRDRVDTLTLGFLADYATVGSYYLAMRVISAPIFLPSSIAGVYYPHLVAEGLDARNRRRIGRISGGLLLIGGVGAAFTWGAAGPIAAAFYGPAGSDVAPILRAAALIIPLGFLDNFLFVCLQALYQERRLVRVAIASTVAVVVGNLTLVPLWGIYGAVFAQATGTGIRLILLLAMMGALMRRAGPADGRESPPGRTPG